MDCFQHELGAGIQIAHGYCDPNGTAMVDCWSQSSGKKVADSIHMFNYLTSSLLFMLSLLFHVCLSGLMFSGCDKQEMKMLNACFL